MNPGNHGFFKVPQNMTASNNMRTGVPRNMLTTGADRHAQLRTLFLVARLRDVEVATWMLDKDWGCDGPESLASFVLHAPQSKPAASSEISLLGRQTRNSAAAVPVWAELSEAPGCWTRRIAHAEAYSKALSETAAAIPGLSLDFGAKNVVNLLYDVDIECKRSNLPALLNFADRETCSPAVGPGPAACLHALSGGRVNKNDRGRCADLLCEATAMLRTSLQQCAAGSIGFWRGEYSPTQMQLHACAAHRWAVALRFRVARTWKGCRSSRATRRRYSSKRPPR